jgi:lipoprotein-anchoring transpeptidase ErfK/SrfK
MSPVPRAALAALAASLLLAAAAAAQAPAAAPESAARPPERWEELGPATANRAPRLPVGGGQAGASVLRVQVLLDRVFFSPGMLDGRWGHNTGNAVRFFQEREGLPATGAVDSATYLRLEALGGADSTTRIVALSEDDVRGPFLEIPADVYAQARLRCSCYESLGEKLSEAFHVHPRLLARLNPGVRLDSLAAGDSLRVPAVRDTAAPAAGVVRSIVVSGAGAYLHALDGEGRILYHFAATLGSSVDPSPEGDFQVTGVHPNPWWNYQPRLLAHVPDDEPGALIPPGPNNAVGTVWMSLSVPHFGIHGTRSPETIGYARSAGCVRLTNWDAEFLSRRLAAGTPVAFRDTRPAEAAPAPLPDGPPDGTAPDSALAGPAVTVPAAAPPPR